MTFEATLKEIGTFKTIIDTFTSILDEASNFYAKPEGFGVIAMDPSHVSMINFFIPKKAFETYKCTKKHMLGLNINNLNKVLRRIGSSETVTMQLSEKENKLNLIFSGKAKRRFTVNLIDLEEEDYPQPKMQFEAKIVLDDPSLLTEAIKDTDLFSDHTKLVTKNNIFSVFAKGDNGEVTVDIPGTKEGISVESKKDSESLYPLSYLTSITKLASVSHRLTLEYTSEMPMQMEFLLKPKNNSIGWIKYFLAPRVEEEEEEGELEELKEDDTDSQETDKTEKSTKQKEEIEEPAL